MTFEKVVSFLDEYSITKESTCKEIREAVKLYKDGADEETSETDSDGTSGDGEELTTDDVMEIIDKENVKSAIDAMTQDEFAAFIKYAREGGYFGE